jgi:photosystem II stability/assembly factor-like uncharacterized protein
MPPRSLLTLGLLLLLPSLASSAAPPVLSPSRPSAAINLAGLVARPIGPATPGGRITSVAVVEKKPTIQYVGTAGGGVWKTIDDGLTWAPVFEGRPCPSIGAVAVAPSNPEVVWVGTGEANARNSVSWGNGVFRSTDAGKTWESVGLADSAHIGRIVVHPHDPKTAWVAALGRLWGSNPERGIFKTGDGGKSWQHVLNLGDETGCVDLAIDPSDPQVLYTAAYRVRRDAFAGGNPAVQFGPRAGLYRSRDGGKTWDRLTKGLPDRPYGRCGLAVAPTDPRTVYAVIQTDQTNIRNVAGQPPRFSNVIDSGGIFRSRDRGETWAKLNDLCPRPFYYGQIRVDPNDGQRIYVLGVHLFVSRDGGFTFRDDGAPGVHPDLHDLWLDPSDPAHMVLAGDGGLYYSSSRGVFWLPVHNLPIGQFYGIGLDSRQPYRVYGGMQDTGSWGGPSRTRAPQGITNADWFRVLGFDGFQCAVDPADPDIIYAEGQYGLLHRIDLRAGRAFRIRPHIPGEPGHRFNWSSPLLISAHDSKTIYYGGNVLFRSLTRGDSWQVISADLTYGKPGPSAESGHTLTTLAESPVEAGVLYTGSDDGRVCVSRTGGRTWVDVSARIPGVAAERWITRIVCSPTLAGAAYLSLTRYRQDDRAPYLFRTDDFGLNWKPLAGNLPREGPIHVLRLDPRRADLLYVGTEFGLFVSLDAGTSWQPLGKGLPPASVQDLAISARDRELVIATHGRSLYILDLASLQDLTPAVQAEPASVLEMPPVVLRTAGRSFNLPARVYAAPNPPEGAVIHYWLKDAPKAGDFRLSVLDSAGKVVRDLSGQAPAEAGLQRIVWDLRRAGAPDRTEVAVRPGEYAVRLETGGRTWLRKFRVQGEG